MELNEDLIVIEPKEAKEKLNNLVELIRKEKNWEVKRSLLTLLNIYLFQTYKPSDRKESTITDDEWEEIKDFCDYESEKTSDDYLEESVEIHDELNPKIWTKEKELIPEVRAKILQIVDKFKALLALDKVDLKVEDIYLLGSNANFNYNEDSDLDIHIIADESFDCSNEHLKIIYDAYKSLFNTKYDITIKGINVEIYVENKDKLSNVSSGVYSFNNGWIKDPKEYEIPEFDQLAVDKGVQKWEDDYYAIMQDPSVKKIDKYIDDIYNLRVDSIQEKGEFGEGNLIFKEIRRLGYLNDLKNKKIELTSKELSLEELQEELHILEEQDKLRFHYRGPVRHFDTIVSNDWEDWTEAVSEKQALNNLTIKAKKYFGYSIDSKFSLNPDYLELSPKNLEPDEKGIEGKDVKCSKCGGKLNDNGECPVCDLGDQSALDEHITPINREQAEKDGMEFEKKEVMNSKVKDWMAGDQPYEFQLDDIPEDLTWGELIDAIKKDEMHKVISLDTAPQEHIWQRACELYYLETGEFASSEFEKMFNDPEKHKWLKLIK